MIASGRSPDDIARAWRRLPRDIPPAVLASAFAPPLSDAALTALLASPRLEERLADRVGERLGLRRPEPVDFTDTASRVVLLGRDSVLEAVRLAGTIRYGGIIGRVVLRDDRERIREATGARAFDLALALGRDDDSAAAAMTMDDLIAACRESGPRCVSAWTAALPPGVGRWLRLVAAISDDATPIIGERRDVEAAIHGAIAVVSSTEG